MPRSKKAAATSTKKVKPNQWLINGETPDYLVRKWFITGILSAAPIIITIWLVWAIVSFTDNILKHLLPHDAEPAVLFGTEIPGLGLIVTFAGLTLIGAFISNFFGRYFLRAWDRFMARVPLISGVYGAIKQVLNSVLSEQGQSFREVVYVEFPLPGMYAMGFVVGPADHFPSKNDEEMVAVFVPQVPMPTSGYLLNMPQKKLIKTDISVEEGLKLSITLGMAKPIETATELPSS
jgi:uncharacterized membrane protein